MPVSGEKSGLKAPAKSRPSNTEATVGAIGTVLLVAKDIGEALEHAPFVKSIAGILVQILKIREEVLCLKDFSQELIELIATRSLPILRGLDELKNQPVTRLDSLESDLNVYYACLHDIHAQLAKLTTRRTMSLILRRGEIKSNLERLKRRIQDFHDTFNVSRLINITQDVSRIKNDYRLTEIAEGVKSIVDDPRLANIADGLKLITEDATIFEIKQDVRRLANDTKILRGIQETSEYQNSTSDDSMFQEPLPPRRKLLHGREEELGRRLELLKTCDNPRIAIVGPGGVGKTSLATNLLHDPDMYSRYGEHRYFVSCEQIITISALLNVFANVLGIPHPERGQHLQRSVLRYLQRWPILLCLDNFEDLWDVLEERRHTEAFLEHLDALPNLGIIITTRVSDRPLRLSWTDSPSDELRPLNEADAIELFECISKYSDPRIADIVKAVEGLPLAVELLALQVARNTMDGFMRLWETEGLRMLDGGSSVDTRSSSVNTSVGLSLSSLRIANHPSAASILRLLTTLPDGLADYLVDLVQACLPSGIPLHQSLRVLCSASLLYRDASDRYRILAPIRQYAEQFIKLDIMLIRGLIWAFVAVLRASSSPSVSTNPHKVVRELCNIEAMIAQGLPLMEGEELAYFIATAINLKHWQHYYVGPSNCDLLNAALHYSPTTALKAFCYAAIGTVGLGASRFDDAEVKLDHAVNRFRSCDEPLGVSVCLHKIGRVHMLKGRWGNAKMYFDQALLILLFKIRDRQRGCEAEVLGSIGQLYWRSGCGLYGDAEALHLQALARFRELDNKFSTAQGHRSLGRFYFECGRLVDAEHHVLCGLELAQELNHAKSEAWSHRYLGEIYLLQHRHTAAETAFLNAASLFHRIGERASEGEDHLNLGYLYVQMYHLCSIDEPRMASLRLPLEQAAREYSKALLLFQQLGEVKGIALADRCLHFLELPRYHLTFDPPEPIVWDTVTDGFVELVSRTLKIRLVSPSGE